MHSSSFAVTAPPAGTLEKQDCGGHHSKVKVLPPRLGTVLFRGHVFHWNTGKFHTVPDTQPPNQTPCKVFIPSCQSVQNVRGISQFSFFLDSQDGCANFVQTNPSLSFPIHFFQKYVKSFWCNLAVRWLLVVSRKTKAALASSGEVESENWR